MVFHVTNPQLDHGGVRISGHSPLGGANRSLIIRDFRGISSFVSVSLPPSMRSEWSEEKHPPSSPPLGHPCAFVFAPFLRKMREFGYGCGDYHSEFLERDTSKN
ncbi:hypothetical protein TNIN_275741 [Trichonephila inaurata madagascariensis]|uniref:Uncharacterized protein n=1 Tax=Trichonephila inaurata madagascariensis TaxID=2747483 RepID=A0A8X6WVA0_9ARAC|nr:hypothetical protein TNIN_275741 [Trichonephila inaurata madagascariensis]